MTKHLERDLDSLKRELLDLCAMAEDATNKAILALTDRRPELAEEVRRGDDAIDEKEVKIEEDCLKILALHQPVAADLRFIVTALKVNSDLERIGDLAINIAERASYLASHEPLAVPMDFPKLVERAQSMVRRSLEALFARDAAAARDVLKMDDEADRLTKEMFKALHKVMHDDPSTIERAVNLLSASRHLERIADQATNIAEDVVFLVEGEIIRHENP